MNSNRKLTGLELWMDRSMPRGGLGEKWAGGFVCVVIAVLFLYALTAWIWD